MQKPHYGLKHKKKHNFEFHFTGFYFFGERAAGIITVILLQFCKIIVKYLNYKLLVWKTDLNSDLAWEFLTIMDIKLCGFHDWFAHELFWLMSFCELHIIIRCAFHHK